jgi:hypothetical protein
MPLSTDSQNSDEPLLSQHCANLELGEKTPEPQPRNLLSELWRLSDNTKRAILTGVFLIVLAIAAITTVSPIVLSTSTPEFYTNRCGYDADSAKAAGCVFDLINYAWQPQECFDEEVFNARMKHSMKKGPFKFYLDKNGTQSIPQDIELLSRTPIVYAEHRYHMEHCLYTWELLHHAVKKNRPIVEFFGEYTHTQHCIGYLAAGGEVPDWEVVNTHVKIWYNPCVMIQ